MKLSIDNVREALKKQGGFVITSELLIIVTILVIGLIVGQVTLRDQVNAELEDTAEAIGSLSQSYEFLGLSNVQGTAITDGSIFVDAQDTIAGDGVSWTWTQPTLVEQGIGAQNAAAPDPRADLAPANPSP